MRFLGLSLADRVPDAKTIWLYRERIKKQNLMESLFALFDRQLKENGYLAMSGQVVDASNIQAPRQRMTNEEKAQVKAGKVPEEWQKNQAKLSQKDRDARWMLKHTKSKGSQESGFVDLAIPQFGDKNHISTDKRHGFIRKYAVTPAHTYDGSMLEALLDPENTASGVWGDTAYQNQKNRDLLESKAMRSEIHRKKPKGRKMSEATRRANGKKSKVRSKIEHVFAVQKDVMNLFIRTIGLMRATVKVGLANLVYNMKRLDFWNRKLALAG